MSKRIFVMALVLALAGTLTAQTTAGSQTNASASGSASVSADKKGAGASAGTSVSASQETTVAKPEEKEKKPAGAQAGAGASGSGSASAETKNMQAALASGTTIEAMLTKSLHAKKNKEGDKVEAKTTSDVKSEGRVVIPKGSKLVGHVTQAKARTKGESDSMLGIQFDRALLKDGREVPLNVVIQAVAAAQTAANADLGPAMQEPILSGSGSGTGSGQASGGGGLLGGAGGTVGAATGTAGSLGSTVGGTVNSTVNTATSATGSVGSTSALTQLTSTTTGVVGLEGLKLDSVASNATQGSVIASDSTNVQLASGTRMLLRATGQ
jgi:hypothetical protein